LRALLFVALVIGLARCLRDHGIDHLRDHALFGDRQCFDLLKQKGRKMLSAGIASPCPYSLQLPQPRGTAIAADLQQAQGIGGAFGFHVFAAGKHHAVAGVQ